MIDKGNLKAKKELIGLDGVNRSFHYFQRNDASFEPFWHFHPELELTFISRGKGLRYIGDSIEPFKVNELILMGENLPHQWVSSVPSSAHVIQFKKSELEGIREVGALQALFHNSRRGLMFECDEQIAELIRSFEERRILSRLAGLIELFDRLSRVSYQYLASEEYEIIHGAGFDKIQSINQFVLDNLTRKIAISEVADKAHMTRQSFCRWFKKETGNTFIDFLNRTKIEIACRLLIENKERISSIAYQVGFESISQFNRTFLKIKGVSPLKYRHAFIV